MTRRAYNTDQVVRLPAPLSNAVLAGNLLFVSGITPFDINRQLVPGDFAAQMRQVMEATRIILADAGTSFERVVKATIMLVDIRNFEAAFAIWREYFQEPYPALTTMECRLARPQFMLEIEFVAEVG
ncbi:MAG: RidA family protein [Alphaproteobacteria bacterium]|nr:RidA family protein [Alphaproteobacteria bacterium]